MIKEKSNSLMAKKYTHSRNNYVRHSSQGKMHSENRGKWITHHKMQKVLSGIGSKKNHYTHARGQNFCAISLQKQTIIGEILQ